MTLLGIDVGTSSVKAVLLDGGGRVLGRASVPHPIGTPNAGWVETHPEEWWRGACKAVAATLGSALERTPNQGVEAVGVSGQMHGAVLAGDDGEAIRSAILWPDERAAAVLDRYAELPGDVRDRLLNPVFPGTTGPLLLWLRDYEPDAYRAARWSLQAKDWVRMRLTGAVHTDPSDASGTLLYDPVGDRWASEVVAALGLRADLLAPLRPSSSQAGTLTSRAAADLGLRAGLPVATGAADTAAALLAGGGTESGAVQITIGTGAQVVAPSTGPGGQPAGGGHLFRSAAPRGLYLLAAVQNAGLALAWVVRALGASWEELYGSLDRSPPGAAGLTFLGHLAAERAPRASRGSRGAWFGLGLDHNRPDLLRSALEGVVYAVRRAYDLLPPTRHAPRLRAGGGGLRPALAQLLADVLERPLQRLPDPDLSARGAALLAGVAAGRLKDVEAAGALNSDEGELVEPEPDNAPAYREAYARYLHLADSTPG